MSRLEFSKLCTRDAKYGFIKIWIKFEKIHSSQLLCYVVDIEGCSKEQKY
jgi:hypothetical protein